MIFTRFCSCSFSNHRYRSWKKINLSDTVAESIMFTKANSRILYTALTGSNYVPYLPSVYEVSIEEYIGEDADED